MADDIIEIKTAIDTDGVDDGMLNIKNLVVKGMDALNSSISGCISTVAGLGSALLNVAETAGKGLLSLGKSAVSVGQNFESSMSQVIATMGVTKDTMTENGENIYDKLSEKAKEMGSTTKFSASEAADALNYLALAGYDAGKACDALPQVLNLAQAGGMDLARTSDLVTDAMSALGIDATTENLQHFGDVLAKTASKSNTSVEQLGDALLVCGGQAKMSGLELNEMATMLGIFADNGIKGSEGGTALRNLLKNMYTPTSKAAQAMEQLGISASDAVTGELRPVQEVLMDTMSAMESLSEADRMQAMSDIFDVQVLASASAALNNSSDRFNELSAEIANCDGAMQQMADTMNDNLEGDLAGLNSSLEGLGVEVYESLSESLRYYVQTGTGYIRQLNDAFKSGGFDGLAKAVGSVLTSAISEISAKIPDVLNIAKSVIMSFLEGLSNNSKGIGVFSSNIVVTITDSIIEFIPQFIATGAKIIVSFVQGLLTKLPEIREKAVDLIQNFATAIKEKIPEIVEKAPEIIEGFIQGFVMRKARLIQTAISLIKNFLQGISKSLPEIAASGIEILQNLINGVVSEIPKLVPIAVEIITGLLNGLTNAINAILEFAPQILEMLINGVISALPQLLELAVNILSTLVDNLANAVTAILEFAPQILTSLIDGIIAVLPMLIDCAINILDALISAIINNLEPILMACVEILMAIVNGIIENLDQLIDAAFQIIQFLIDELLKNDNLQKILDVAIDILMAVTDGIIDNLDELIDAAVQIIEKIISELLQEDNIGKLIDTGIELLEKVIVGLCRFAGRLAEFAGKLFVTLGEELAKIDWSELGKNVLDGIISGFTGVDFNVDEFTGDFGENWVSGFKDIVSAGKDFFNIGSPSKLMRDEIGRWLLPGIAVGVENTSDETADDINSSLESISEQLEIPEFEINSTKISVSEVEPVEFKKPEIEPLEIPEQSEIKVKSPKISVSENQPIKFDNPEIEPLEIPAQSEIEVKSPKISVSESAPIKFDNPEIKPLEIPAQSEIEVKSLEINVSEPKSIKLDSPEITDFYEPNTEIFNQQIEILRKFAPVKDVPELDDERITTEIQSQLDELMVTLNADNFISRFEAILSGMGNASVPQYSEVYGQIQTVPEKSENRHSEIPQNIQLSPKISVFIGDTEIKDFVISAIDETNAVSGGVSV
ncbi:MAG: phage tail tape measure protein [Ruminococcus sp.]|nr:phage tail tape measure protein [Ruminococcus sp.]